MFWCFEFYTQAIFCHCCHWGGVGGGCHRYHQLSYPTFLCACDAIAVMITTLVTTQKIKYVATIVFCFYFHNRSHIWSINLVNCNVVKLTSHFRPYLQNIKEKNGGKSQNYLYSYFTSNTALDCFKPAQVTIQK